MQVVSVSFNFWNHFSSREQIDVVFQDYQNEFWLFFLGLLLATFVWQIVAQSLGPVVGGWLYGFQVEHFEKSGHIFSSEAQYQEWRDKSIASSMNWGLIFLAVLCGGLAGAFGYPLLGFRGVLTHGVGRE